MSQGSGDVILRHAKADLLQVACISPQHGHFTPVQIGGDHQPVKAIVIGFTRPDALECFDEGFAHLLQVDLGSSVMLQVKVVQPVALAGRDNCVGSLTDHTQPQIFHDRQHIGERNREIRVIQLEVDATTLSFRQPIKRHRQRFTGIQPGQLLQVEYCSACTKGIAITRWKSIAEAVHQTVGLLLAKALHQGLVQLIAPTTRQLCHLGFQMFDIDLTGSIVAETQDELYASQNRLGEIGIKIAECRIELFAQQVLNTHAQVGGKNIARHKDQTRVEAPGMIGADKQAYAAALPNIEYPQRRMCQLPDIALKQVVAGINLKNLLQLLAVVAIGGKAGNLHHRLELAPQQWDVAC